MCELLCLGSSSKNDANMSETTINFSCGAHEDQFCSPFASSGALMQLREDHHNSSNGLILGCLSG